MRKASVLVDLRKAESELVALRKKKEMLIENSGLTQIAPYVDEIVKIRSRIERKKSLDLEWLGKQIKKIDNVIAKSGMTRAQAIELMPRRTRSRRKPM